MATFSGQVNLLHPQIAGLAFATSCSFMGWTWGSDWGATGGTTLVLAIRAFASTRAEMVAM